MILLRQAARSIWRNRKAYIACVALMAVGIAMFISFNLLFVNLTAAMDGFYDGQRFGDGFAVLKAMPLSSVSRVESIEGIRQADATIVTDARVQKPESTRVITLRISSIDPQQDGRLNDFTIVKGTLPGEGGILISDVFAAANGFSIGDELPLIVEGQRVLPVISGFVQSPEYVYAIPDSGQIMPDNEAFGFGYLDQKRLGELTGKTGTATNLSFLLEEGVTYEQIKPQLEEALAPYGLASLFARKDQPSHGMLKQEIDSIGQMSTSIPMVFIIIAVIILYIMLGRIIEQERAQIGTMKAFGLSSGEIILHYMCYGGITGLAGGVLGVLFGILMTDGMAAIYLAYFSLPAIRVPPDIRFLISGFLMALLSGLGGAFMGTRSVLRLSPSQAMRPAAPPAVKSDLVGKIPVLKKLLTSLGFMAVRNITRNRFRSAFVVGGVAVSFALTAFMVSYNEMFDMMVLDQFTKVETYDLRISLSQPAPQSAAKEAAFALDGVQYAETLLELPTELRKNHIKKSISVIGLEPGSTLYKIYDNESGMTLPVPQGGMILSSSAAQELGVSRGDTLMMKTPYTGDDEYAVPVLEVVQSNLGATGYMSQESLCDLLNMPLTATSIILTTPDPAPIKEALLDAEQVAGILDNAESIKIFSDFMDSFAAILAMMQLMGAVVAFAIITNTAAISLSERKREYATMRVMGLYPREIGQVVGFEYWALTLVALPPGILLTRWFKLVVAGMIDNDIFTMPLYTAPSSYLTAAMLCMAAVALSNWSARRKIATFDMVEVLKERE